MTICKTIKVASGFNHRIHRSPKNRAPFIRKQVFNPQINAPKIEKNDILAKLEGIDDLLVIANGSKLTCKRSKILKGKKIPLRPLKRVRSPNFKKLAPSTPILRCFNCGFLQRLRFDPRRDSHSVEIVHCPQCGERSHWTNYLCLSELLDWIHFANVLWRDLIQEKKITFRDIIY